MQKTEGQIGIRVTAELRERIQAQAKKEQRNISNFIIKVLTDYLDQVEKK